MTDDQPRAIVVGGSMGGLTAALVLRELGMQVDVFERSPELLDGRGAGIVLQPDTVRWFREHGGTSAVDKVSTGSSHLRYIGAGDEIVFDEPSTWRFTSWTTTYKALLSDFGTERYHLGEHCAGLDQDADGVDLRFVSGRQERADLVVFADGENVWQRSLRLMRHPHLRGVSVLHNSHLAAPYDAAAPTKPHWAGFFSDTTNVDAMVCLTERQRTDLLQRYPGLPLHVLRHAAPKPKVRGVRRDGDSVVFVGRLAPQKQLDHLLRAFVLVHEQVPGAHLDVYGHGVEEESLKMLTTELGLDLGTTVRFHGATSQALHAFAGARVAAMTSFHEGLPLTLTEAMSVGTPFVAYDCNYGPAEVIRDGENGFLVARDDVPALADRLVQVLQDDRLARRLGREAKRVTTSFSPRRYRDAWRDLLGQVASRESSSSHTVASS